MARVCGEPPNTDRAAEIGGERSGSFSIGVDWLECSTYQLTAAQVEARLLELLPGEFIDAEHGGLGYAHQRVGPCGMRVYFDERRPEAHFRVSGEGCAALGTAGQVALVKWAAGISSTCSRLDVAGDDMRPERPQPADVRVAVERGELVTHTVARTWHEDLSYGGGGSTITFGKRGSRRHLRVYDKGAESGGVIDATRWELELRDQEALRVLVALCEAETWAELFESMLVSLVDFRQRWERVTVTECSRSPWFDALVGVVAKWVPYAPKAPRSLEAVREWVRRQVAPALAALAAGDGDLFGVLSLVNEGKPRMGPRYRLMVAQAMAA